jgi:DnaK suppressor protein
MRKANGKAVMNGTGALRSPKASVNNGSTTAKTAAKNGVKPASSAIKPARPALAAKSAAGTKHSPVNGLAKLARATAPIAPAPPPPPADSRFAPYQDILIAKRHELIGSLEDVKFDTLARLGRVAEEDQAQISHEEFISLQRNSMDYQALRLVDGALDRIRAGEYGICQECEKEISPKRLAVIPWAKYCVHCQDRAADNTSAEQEYDAADAW